jgi:type 1 glutamine amidotransferase
MKHSILCLTLLIGAAMVRADEPKPIRALLVIGGCCHDYAKQKDILTQGISARANVQWVIAYDPDTSTKHMNPVYEKPGWANAFDVVVHDECSSAVTDLAVIDRILEPHRQGLPAVVLHCGMHSYRSQGYPDAVTPWFEFTGLPSTRHDRQEPIALSFLDKNNPITKGMADWTTIKEELYNNYKGNVLDTARPLVRGKQTTQDKKGQQTNHDYVVAWTNNYKGKAKVFGTTLGHNNATVADPRYLDLVTRGLLWSVGKLDASYLKPAQKVLLEVPPK